MTSNEGTVSDLRRYLAPSPLRGRTTEAVTDALREAILDGALAPSAWLREDELAEAFAVSRTPIREALRRLSDEGLAVKTAHHGTVVAPLSLEDILALYVVRENLEGLVARLVATRRPAGVVERLEEIHARMRETANSEDTRKLVAENLEYHRAIREAAGNPYLERFLGQVEHAVRRLPGSTFAQPGRTEEMLKEHQLIIAAIAAGDGDAAEIAAKEHMRRAREIRLLVMLGS
jgi:DNA-binding GntR family transcriptional regulator